jgi:excisionase family DNA binding protein
MSELEQLLQGLVEPLLRRVLREELAATRDEPPTELVTVAMFAAEHSIAPATVRAMIKDGRLEATRIGKRAIRVRRDALIAPTTRARAVASADTPAERARRLVEKLR